MTKPIAALAALGVLAAAASAAAQPQPRTGPILGPSTNGAPPSEWGKGVSEWTAPKNIYVTGDPIRLTKETLKPGKRVTFVACPHIQDSDPTPLWFTRHEGETYFLRAQQNMTALVHHPDLLHKVLVEGVVSDEPRVGPGLVLSPLFISVMPEISPECNEILPPDGTRIKFAKRAPGPGGDGTGRQASQVPYRAMVRKMWAADYKPDPVEKREVREFRILYAFDDAMADNIFFNFAPFVKYARDVEAKTVEVIATRGSVRLDNGQVLVERPEVAHQRADRIKRVLLDYGVPEKTIVVRADIDARPAGDADFANRYVNVVVTPSPEKTQALAAK